MPEWILVDKLTVEDICSYPVWEFMQDREIEVPDTAVRPVRELPVEDLLAGLWERE